MMPIRGSRVATVFACSLVLAASATLAATGAGEVGSLAADFELQAHSGQVHRLSEYRDHVVMLAIIGYG